MAQRTESEENESQQSGGRSGPVPASVFARLKGKTAEARVRGVTEYYSALRTEASEVLATAIADLLLESKESRQTAESADAIAESINRALADARLAIRDPQTGLQAKVIVNKTGGIPGYRYLRLFDSRPSVGGRRNTMGLNDLDLHKGRLELMEDTSLSSGRNR
jgi:hypothetical protein